LNFNPAKDREQDAQRRADAQARRPLIAKWAPDIPTGYIHIDDAIEYIRRRWGKAVRAETLEAFSRDATGPKYVIFGDWPDTNRGERYYAFDDIDMWVYRTFTGVPASWRHALGGPSTVPTKLLGDNDYAKEQGRVRTRIGQDGRRRSKASAPEDSDAGEAADGRRATTGRSTDGSA
jgi:hypothetical protein